MWKSQFWNSNRNLGWEKERERKARKKRLKFGPLNNIILRSRIICLIFQRDFTCHEGKTSFHQIINKQSKWWLPERTVSATTTGNCSTTLRVTRNRNVTYERIWYRNQINQSINCYVESKTPQDVHDWFRIQFWFQIMPDEASTRGSYVNEIGNSGRRTLRRIAVW